LAEFDQWEGSIIKDSDWLNLINDKVVLMQGSDWLRLTNGRVITKRDVGDIPDNLMNLGGSLGNVPQQFKNIVIKTRYISEC
jgi:hypothetical protein